MTSPQRVVHVVTVAMTLPFLDGLLQFLRTRQVDVHVVAAPEPLLDEFAAAAGVQRHAVAMTRRISPVRDLLALWRLYRLFTRLRPDVVHAHTPKGGMLGVVAARLARVPAVLYTIHGLPFASATGGRRALLKACELVSCRLAHRVFCVSGSIRSLALEETLTRADKLSVVANGSVGGIDADERFAPALHVPAAAAWRIAHGIPVDATVVTFIGRLTRDKGILELQRAWRQVRTMDAGAHLVMVGPLDSQEPAILDAVQRLGRDVRVRLVGLEWNTAPILAASNLLVLPTYREGFPVTLLEAAAMALPVVASAVPGCTDAVKPGVTGTLVPVKDPDALACAIGSYLNDPASRVAHGATARAWVLRDFRPEVIWNETYAAYRAAVASPAGQRGGAGKVAIATRNVD